MLAPASLCAQRQPPDLCFVISEPGNTDEPLARSYEVKQQYLEGVFYYNTDRHGVERIPSELTQMDCGLPWTDWEDHAVMLPPLRWWVSAHQSAGTKELIRGS